MGQRWLLHTRQRGIQIRPNFAALGMQQQCCKPGRWHPSLQIKC